MFHIILSLLMNIPVNSIMIVKGTDWNKAIVLQIV